MRTLSDFVLVPKEATTEMVLEGSVYHNRNNERSIYSAMLVSRPSRCAEIEQAVERVIEAAKMFRNHPHATNVPDDLCCVCQLHRALASLEAKLAEEKTP